MKTESKAARQGEAFFFRIPKSKVPKGAKAVKPEGGSIIAAHSETGHHHVIDATGVTMLQDPANPLVCYLRMDTVSHMDVVHLRPHDTHETIRLLGKPGDVWQRNLQREWSPEGWVAVRD